jgi:hypothetical protein
MPAASSSAFAVRHFEQAGLIQISNGPPDVIS